MFKKIIALTSAVCILFSTAVYAEGGALSSSDNIIDMIEGNADYQYNCADGLLDTLEITKGYNDEAYGRYSDITRADFAVLTARTLKTDFGSAPPADVFDDVKSDHYAAGAISALKDFGMIDGDGDNCFRPENPIKLSEAVKILCKGIGYNYYAENGGGYASGYISAANDTNLLKNIKLSADDTLTKNETVLLLFNALHTNIAVQTKFGIGAQFEISPYKTVLTEYHKVYYTDGIVKSNKITGISSPDTSKNSIDVGDMTLLCENMDAERFLGYNARVYYKDGQASGENVIYIMPKNKNSELIIEGNDADTVYNINERKISYYDASGKERDARLESNFKLIYNGKAEGDYNSVMDNLKDAHVRLLDNNGDGRYDIVFVNKYKDVVVKSVNENEEIIYDMYSSLNNWNYGNIASDAIFEITDGKGNIISVSDILPWRVVSIISSNDGEYVKAIVKDEYIFGTITQMTKDEDIYFIDGKEYRATKTFLNSSNQNLYVGLSGTFCLNADGKIAAFVKEDVEILKYGILLKSWNEEDEKIGVRLSSQDGIICSYECAKKVNTGLQTLKRSDFYEMIKNETEVLVRYSINKDGHLNRLELPSLEPEFNKNAQKNGFYQYKEEASRKYRKKDGNFNDDFLINSSTVIMGIYSNNTGDEEKYRKLEMGNLTDDSSYNISAYTDEANPSYARVVLIKMKEDADSYDWCPLAVTDISETLNSDGEVVSEIKGYNAGGYTSVETESTQVVSSEGIVEGDIVKIKRNAKGRVSKIEKVYDSTEKKLTSVPAGFNAKERFQLVNPYAVSEDTLKYVEDTVTGTEKESQLKQKTMKNAVIVTTNTQKGDVYISGSLNDIVTYNDSNTAYSKVFMFTNYSEARFIAIIK